MKRVEYIAMRALCLGCIATTLFALGACKHTGPTVTPVRAERPPLVGVSAAASSARGPAPTPAPSAPPDAAASPAVAAPTAPAPSSADEPGVTWTSPSVVAELARDCAYLPGESDGESFAALRCDYDLHPQSCTADPCNDHVNQPCRTVCGSQCDGCSTRCRASCQACTRGCHDDACRAACAPACGACLQTCMQTRDRCLTAVCGARYETCSRRYNADFDRRCLPACRRCEEQCSNSDELGRCVMRCARRGGCTADQAGDCAFTGAVSHVQAAAEDAAGSDAPDGGG